MAGCIPIDVPINCLYNLQPNLNILFFKQMFSSSIKNDVGIDLLVLLLRASLQNSRPSS